MRLGKIEKEVLTKLRAGKYIKDYWGSSKTKSVVSVGDMGIIQPYVLEALQKKKLVTSIKDPFNSGRMRQASYYGLTELGKTIQL